MFGHDWDVAEATIVARDATFTGDGAVATYTYAADVRLASGETFRTTVHEPTIATDFWPPDIADTVSVLVRPKDRKVKFDKDDDRLSLKAYHARKKQAFEDARREPAGTPPAPGATSTRLAGLPDDVADQLARLGIVPGATTQVFTGDSAQGQAALAALVGAAAATPVAETPETRLARLQSLQERGLVTAEEYAEQRQRILDEL
jgi:hypothetical protein